MARLIVIACLIFAAGAAALSLRSDPWIRAGEKAAQDAALFSGLIAHPDRIGWRITEDLSLRRVMLWGSDASLRYPVPEGFTPLLYEFSEDEIRTMSARQSGISEPIWEQFDTSGRELLHCRALPSICLVYDRQMLEEMIGARHGALLETDRGRFWPIVLLVLASACGGIAIWQMRRSRQGAHRFSLLPERHSAMRGALEIPLSARDLKLMVLLCDRNGAVVTKDELYDAGWGRDFMPNSRALDQHIINLRRKLDPDKSRPILIETVHGVGYRLLR